MSKGGGFWVWREGIHFVWGYNIDYMYQVCTIFFVSKYVEYTLHMRFRVGSGSMQLRKLPCTKPMYYALGFHFAAKWF